MKITGLAIIAGALLIPNLSPGEVELPESTEALLKKLSQFRANAELTLDNEIASAEKSALGILAKHFERESAAGNLDGALALEKLEELSVDLKIETLDPALPADSKAVAIKFINFAKKRADAMTASVRKTELAVVKLLEQDVSEQTKSKNLDAALAIRNEIEKIKKGMPAGSALAESTGPKPTPPASRPPLGSSGPTGKLGAIIEEPGVVEIEEMQSHPLTKSPPEGAKKWWTSVPSNLEAAGATVFWTPNKYLGIAKYKVTSPGYLIVACNYDYQGNSGGDWEKTRWTEEDFKKNGWRSLTEGQIGGKLILHTDREQILLYKKLDQGEAGELRCNKYDPPFFIMIPGS